MFAITLSMGDRIMFQYHGIVTRPHDPTPKQPQHEAYPFETPLSAPGLGLTCLVFTCGCEDEGRTSAPQRRGRSAQALNWVVVGKVLIYYNIERTIAKLKDLG